MKIKRKGSAVWQGGIKDGTGKVSTGSGALTDVPYGFNSRFENGKGTNPEELIGAAHAGCFTMALSKILGDAGFVPARLATTAEVTLEQQDGGFSIPAIKLVLEAKVPGLDKTRFEELAGQAKAGCPVSKLFKADITLEAKLLDG